MLPVEEFPQFASQGAVEYSAADGSSPFAPIEGERYAGALHADDSWMRLTRTVDVPAGSTAELQLQLSYDVEPGYDHVVVEARTAGGGDWTTLPDLNGGTSTALPAECEAGFFVETHPFLSQYLTGADCTGPGTSGEWNSFTGSSDGWTQAAFDLSAYAGSTVEVSVSYVTDPAFGGVGVFVDDTRVVVDGVDRLGRRLRGRDVAVDGRRPARGQPRQRARTGRSRASSSGSTAGRRRTRRCCSGSASSSWRPTRRAPTWSAGRSTGCSARRSPITSTHDRRSPAGHRLRGCGACGTPTGRVRADPVPVDARPDRRLCHHDAVDVDRLRLEATAALRAAGASFAYVHGSRAHGTPGPRSDLDVAAYWGAAPPASFDVDVPPGVDLMVLDTAPLELRGRVAARGTLLFEGDPATRVHWEAMTRKIWFDERPRIERAHREFAAALARA